MPGQKAFQDNLFWPQKFCFSTYGEFSWFIYNEGETPGIADSFGRYGHFTLGQPCGFLTLLE